MPMDRQTDKHCKHYQSNEGSASFENLLSSKQSKGEFWQNVRREILRWARSQQWATSYAWTRTTILSLFNPRMSVESHTDMAIKKKKQSPDNLWNVWIGCREKKITGQEEDETDESWRRAGGGMQWRKMMEEEGRRREGGKRSGDKQEKACKAWSIVILLVCVEGYLSSHFFLLSSNISFLPPRSLLWSLSAPLLLFPISLCFYSILYSSLCFQLCPLNPLIFSPSNLFHLTPSQTHILNSPCVFWVHLNKCCAKCFSR